jgi:hypothetical protein
MNNRTELDQHNLAMSPMPAWGPLPQFVVGDSVLAGRPDLGSWGNLSDTARSGTDRITSVRHSDKRCEGAENFASPYLGVTAPDSSIICGDSDWYANCLRIGVPGDHDA